jgi:hypothetical protein
MVGEWFVLVDNGRFGLDFVMTWLLILRAENGETRVLTLGREGCIEEIIALSTWLAWSCGVFAWKILETEYRSMGIAGFVPGMN